MSARSRLRPWFHDVAPGACIRVLGEEAGVPIIRVADFDRFGTLVHIGAHCHHFPPGSWDACFPRPPFPQPDKEHLMTTIVDDTKTPVVDDTKPASKAGKAPPPPKAYKERLPCKLTDKERLEIGALIVAADDEISTLEEDKKSASDGFKAKIELAQGRHRELVQKLRSGEEVRAVDCIERFVFERNTVEEIRTDTNARLSERAMTPDERQGKLALEDAPPARKAPDAPPTPPGPTDITVTPNMLADAERAAKEDGAPASTAAPRRRKKPEPETPAQG